ncbi:MAG: DUF192 domain-containing protein [Planctomycetaceae bacterium]
MPLLGPVLAGCTLLVAVGCSEARPVAGGLPPEDGERHTFAPGASASDLDEAIREAMATPGKGPDFTRFVVIADGSRFGSAFRIEAFHAVVGGGGLIPEGALVIRRNWALAGAVIDGRNDVLETTAVSLVVEPAAARPYSPAVARAAAAFCAALAGRAPLHPDAVLGMGEVPFARPHPGAEEEARLAGAARLEVPVPPADLTLHLAQRERRVAVAVETRSTPSATRTGMMLRRRFDGENRGMLFLYPHRKVCLFHASNCFVSIDVAYILDDGTVDQLFTMDPQPGVDAEGIRYYESRSFVRTVLEMPAGWFARQGLGEGAKVEGLPPR